MTAQERDPRTDEAIRFVAKARRDSYLMWLGQAELNGKLTPRGGNALVQTIKEAFDEAFEAAIQYAIWHKKDLALLRRHEEAQIQNIQGDGRTEPITQIGKICQDCPWKDSVEIVEELERELEMLRGQVRSSVSRPQVPFLRLAGQSETVPSDDQT